MNHFYHELEGFSSEEDQGQLLETILTQINLKNTIRIAEIGVYQGRGTSMWNVILINNNINYEYYAIDHFLGSLEHDKNLDYYGITLKNLSPIKDKIKIIKNDSIMESKNYPDEFFDIVYIDASHDYYAVKMDILSWLPKVKSGGIICGDDYIVGWDGVIMAVDELFKNKVNKVGYQQWWVKK